MDRATFSFVTSVGFGASTRLFIESRPFQTVAICVLPDHLHAVWSLPPSDAVICAALELDQGLTSRELPGEMERGSSETARRSGNLAAPVSGARRSRRCRPGATRRLHSFQSRQAWASLAGLRLAVQQLPSLCRAEFCPEIGVDVCVTSRALFGE